MSDPASGRVLTPQEAVEKALRKHILQPDDSTWYAVTARSVLDSLTAAGYYLIDGED